MPAAISAVHKRNVLRCLSMLNLSRFITFTWFTSGHYQVTLSSRDRIYIFIHWKVKVDDGGIKMMQQHNDESRLFYPHLLDVLICTYLYFFFGFINSFYLSSILFLSYLLFAWSSFTKWKVDFLAISFTSLSYVCGQRERGIFLEKSNRSLWPCKFYFWYVLFRQPLIWTCKFSSIGSITATFC